MGWMGWMDGWMDNQANARLPTSEITDLLVSDEICSLHSIYPSSRRPPPYNATCAHAWQLLYDDTTTWMNQCSLVSDARFLRFLLALLS